MYTGKMQSRILNAIENTPVLNVPFQGEHHNFKDLQGLHLVVEVVQNAFDSGFVNGDVCRVLYEYVNDPQYVVIQRLEDKLEGKISKQLLRIPVEFMNFQQYLLGDGIIKEGGF